MKAHFPMSDVLDAGRSTHTRSIYVISSMIRSLTRSRTAHKTPHAHVSHIPLPLGQASILNIEFGTPVVATPPCKKASFFGPRSSSLDNLGRQRPRNEMRLKNAGDAKPSGSLIQLPVEAPVESSSDPTFSPIPAAKPSVGPGPPAEKSPAAQPSSSAEECNPPGAPVVAKAAESSSIAVEAVSVAAPAGPRRRKLVRGANNIEQKVLPELTDAVIALESLDDFLDVAYSEIGKSKESNKNDLEHSSIADSHGKEAGSNTQTAKPDDDVIIVEKSAAEVAEVDAHKVQIVQNTVDPKESLPAMQNEPVAQDDRHSPSQPSTVVKTEESITVFCEHGETHLEPDQVPEPIATDNGAEKGAKSRKDNETAFPTNAMESKQVDANPIEGLTRTENIGALEKKKEKWTERLSLVLGRLDDYSAADSFMHTRNDASVGDCNSGCEVIDTIFQMSKSDVGDIDVGGDDGVSEIETGAAISGAEGSESNKPPPRAEKLVPRSNDSIDGPDKTDTEDEGVASWRGEAFSKDAGVFSKGKKAFPNAQGAECRVDRAGLGVDDATPPKTCNDEVLSTTAVPPAESEDVPAYNDAQTLDDGNLSIGSADSDTPCFAAATPSQADCSACGRFCFEFAGRMLYTASDEIVRMSHFVIDVQILDPHVDHFPRAWPRQVCGIEWNDGLYGEEVQLVNIYFKHVLYKSPIIGTVVVCLQCCTLQCDIVFRNALVNYILNAHNCRWTRTRTINYLRTTTLR